MAQKSIKAKTKGKSFGALRKHVGDARKKTVHSKAKKDSKAQAQANYIKSVETAMASRVPSDQRSKLKVVKSTGPIEKKKNKKKPLTRGRTRRADRKNDTMNSPQSPRISLSTVDLESLRSRLRVSELERSKLLNENSSLRSLRAITNEREKSLKDATYSRTQSTQLARTSSTRPTEDLSRRVDQLEAEKAYFQVLVDKLEKRVNQLEEEKRELELQLASQDETESSSIIRKLNEELQECHAIIARKNRESASVADNRVNFMEGDINDLKIMVRELSRRATSVAVDTPTPVHRFSSTVSPSKGSVESLQRIILQQGQYIKALQDEIALYCCSPESSVPLTDKVRGFVSCSRPEKSSHSPPTGNVTETDWQQQSIKSSKKGSDDREEHEPDPHPPRTAAAEEETENESHGFNYSYCSFGYKAEPEDSGKRQVHFDDAIRQSDLLRLTDPGDLPPDSCPSTPPPRKCVLLNSRLSDCSRPSESGHEEDVTEEMEKENKQAS